MDAKKCDVCGNFYEHYGKKVDDFNTAYVQTNSERGIERNCKRYDLCPECMGKVLAVLKGGRE